MMTHVDLDSRCNVDESGFLVLDDVTIQSDDPRTLEFLEILHGLSEDRSSSSRRKQWSLIGLARS
jgi:hypothetical protein